MVSLQKGGSISLTKVAADAGKTLSEVVAGAGWDGTSDAPIDLDLVTVKLGADGKAISDANGNGTNADEAVNFFGNLETKGAKHTGDNLTGEGDGDDEQVRIKLADLEAEVIEVAVLVLSYSGETFDQVANIKARMVNADGDEEMAVFTNSELGSAKAVEMGRLKRAGADWTFEATGKTLTEADGKEKSELLKAVLTSYGVTGL